MAGGSDAGGTPARLPRALTCRPASAAAPGRRRAVLQLLRGSLRPAKVPPPQVGPAAASGRHQQRLQLPLAHLRGQPRAQARAPQPSSEAQGPPPAPPGDRSHPGTQGESDLRSGRSAALAHPRYGFRTPSTSGNPRTALLPGRRRCRPRRPRRPQPSAATPGPLRCHPSSLALRPPRTLRGRRAGSPGSPADPRHTGVGWAWRPRTRERPAALTTALPSPPHPGTAYSGTGVLSLLSHEDVKRLPAAQGEDGRDEDPVGSRQVVLGAFAAGSSVRGDPAGHGPESPRHLDPG